MPWTGHLRRRPALHGGPENTGCVACLPRSNFLSVLENFSIQISAGSMSNILTKTADSFAHEFDDIVHAGLSSTPYQQTDDTSARVAGQFWHTHILCNPFYVAYFTRPRKDRLTVLEVLQNTNDLRFRFGEETLHLLQAEFDIPQKWQQAVEELCPSGKRAKPILPAVFMLASAAGRGCRCNCRYGGWRFRLASACHPSARSCGEILASNANSPWRPRDSEALIQPRSPCREGSTQ